MNLDGMFTKISLFAEVDHEGVTHNDRFGPL